MSSVAVWKQLHRYDASQDWHITDICQNEDQGSAGYLHAYKSLLSKEIKSKLDLIWKKKTLLWDVLLRFMAETGNSQSQCKQMQ
jgi:hypothetical protein